MDFPTVPHRCPKCQALVVDRRSPVCTTCRTELPKDWIMTVEQIAKTTALDQEMRAEHVASMNTLDPRNDPNMPPLIRLLDTPANGLL
jgi:hypothetical protein